MKQYRISFEKLRAVYCLKRWGLKSNIITIDDCINTDDIETDDTFAKWYDRQKEKLDIYEEAGV